MIFFFYNNITILFCSYKSIFKVQWKREISKRFNIVTRSIYVNVIVTLHYKHHRKTPKGILLCVAKFQIGRVSLLCSILFLIYWICNISASNLCYFRVLITKFKNIFVVFNKIVKGIPPTVPFSASRLWRERKALKILKKIKKIQKWPIQTDWMYTENSILKTYVPQRTYDNNCRRYNLTNKWTTL